MTAMGIIGDTDGGHIFDTEPTPATYNRGCRCDQCKAKKREWHADYMKRRYLSRNQVTVDARPIRQHLLWLMDNGVGPKRVAELVGLSLSSMHIYRISSGKTKRVRRSTARAILSVDRTAIADTAVIDAGLTWRRLHGLMALGWTGKFLGAELGFNPSRRTLPIARTRTTAANARAVVELVHRYGFQAGPSELSRSLAAKRGWAPYGEWDDDLSELTDFQSLLCAQCGGRFRHSKPGRIPDFCSDICRRRAAHDRRPRSA